MTNTTFIALTIGALFQPQFEALIPILKSNKIEKELNKESKENKLLGIKTESSRKRILTDIRRRVKYAPVDFWDFYSEANDSQKRIMLFYLILKAYPIALDLQFEVVIAKWKKMERKIDKFDLQMRMEELASSNETMEGWSETTKSNTTSNFLRSLEEAGLMKQSEITKPTEQPVTFWKYFIQIGESWFLEACLLSKTERAVSYTHLTLPTILRV